MILLLDLALGSAERELTLARLATMGLGTGQSRRLALPEILPAVLAAAVAAFGCAWALVPLTGTVLNLTAFTGSAASVPVRPDVPALALPVAGLAVLGAGTLVLQVRAARRDLSGALRPGP